MDKLSLLVAVDLHHLRRGINELHVGERSNLWRQAWKDVQSQSGIDQSL